MLAVNVAADFTRTYPDYFRFVFLIFFRGFFYSVLCCFCISGTFSDP